MTDPWQRTGGEEPPFARAVWTIKVICGPWKKGTLLPDSLHSAGRDPVVIFGWGVWRRVRTPRADGGFDWHSADPGWVLMEPPNVPQRYHAKNLPLWKPGVGDDRRADPPHITGGHVVWSRPTEPRNVQFKPFSQEADGGAIFRLFCTDCEAGIGDLHPTYINDAFEIRGRSLYPILDHLWDTRKQQVTLKDLRRRIRNSA